MAKTKETKEDDFYLQLAKATGGNILKGLGAGRFFIDTGNLALNYINSGRFITGGIPNGISEAYGPPATAKSVLGAILLGNVQKMGGYAFIEDVERASNEDFYVKAGHVDRNRLIVHVPYFIEEVERKVTNTIRAVREHDKRMKRKVLPPILFVWDSISVSPTEREWKETELPEDYSEAMFKKIVGGKERPGERARAAGNFLRKINPFLANHNASMFVINQTRANIGNMYDPETTAGGGKALPFYANCRLRMGASKQIEDKTRNNLPIGVNLTAKNKKSRAFNPYMKTEGIQLYFDRGIDPLSGLLTVLMNAGRVQEKDTDVFIVLPEWTGGKAFEFEASKKKNLISPELVLKFPRLIDAENEEQVHEYLKPFAEAIATTKSGEIRETDMEDDDVDDDDEMAKKLEDMTEEEILK